MLAAWEMAKDHPIVGVGPGCYRYEFYDYKLRVEDKYQSLAYATMRSYNFGDAHNDHLQTLAQTGIPGYALLVAVIAIVARRSFVRAPGSTQRNFARLASLPLVVAFAVSAMPQFPMELAGPMTTLIAIAVPCMANPENDAPD
jgi:O-antigen ligase